jgi:hypothetical protein
MNANAAGPVAGEIANTTTADTIVLVTTGTALPTPVTTVTGTLTAFTQLLGTPSATQTYTISGTNLTGNVTVTPATGYEVSANGGTNWFTNATPLVLTPTGGALASTTITVRLNAAALGAQIGTISHATPGGVTTAIAVIGNTNAVPLITANATVTSFDQIIGAPSAEQTYTLSGAALTGNIIITPPARFEISVNSGITWTRAPVTLTRTGTAVPVTTVRVRLNSGLTGQFTGNIVHTSSSATNVNIAVSGITHVKEEFSVYPTLVTHTLFIAHPVTTEKANLIFYNSDGKQILAMQASANSVETPVDVSNFRQGLFYVEYISANKKVLMKFVKQ